MISSIKQSVYRLTVASLPITALIKRSAAVISWIPHEFTLVAAVGLAFKGQHEGYGKNGQYEDQLSKKKF